MEGGNCQHRGAREWGPSECQRKLKRDPRCTEEDHTRVWTSTRGWGSRKNGGAVGTLYFAGIPLT